MPRKAKTAVVEPVAATPDALRERFAQYPELKVWERKLLDPNDPGSLPILLKDDPDPCCGDIGHAFEAKPGAEKCPVCRVPFRLWYVRWINIGEPERWSTVKERGYIKVQVKDLRDADDIAGMSDAKPEDVVTRGDRKTELLAKIPFYFYIGRKREAQRRYLERRNPKAMKKAIVESAEAAFGDEGAQSTHDHLHIEVAKRHGSRSLAEELGGAE